MLTEIERETGLEMVEDVGLTRSPERVDLSRMASRERPSRPNALGFLAQLARRIVQIQPTNPVPKKPKVHQRPKRIFD